jgi:hypothetical protein
MTGSKVPARHWHCYGDDPLPLPTGQQALDKPRAAFPSWYLRVVRQPDGSGPASSRPEAVATRLPSTAPMAFWGCHSSTLASNMEFAGQTFASIGLTPGTYTWTWGSAINADSLTVQIGPAAGPEPASVRAVGLGLLGLAAVHPLVVARRGSCASPAITAAGSGCSRRPMRQRRHADP